MLVLAPTVLLFFPALGLATGVVAAALFAAMLVVFPLLPLLESLYPVTAVARPRAWGAAPRRASAVVLAVVCRWASPAVDRFDAAHPAPEQLMYALDTDTLSHHFAPSGPPLISSMSLRRNDRSTAFFSH